MARSVTRTAATLRRTHRATKHKGWGYMLPIPYITFNSVMVLHDDELGQLIKHFIMYMMTDGEVRLPIKYSNPENEQVYHTMLDYIRRYMHGKKKHLTDNMQHSKAQFRALFTETDTEGIEELLQELETGDDDMDEFTEGELMEADDMPEVTLTRDTVVIEKRHRAAGKRTVTPSRFSPRRDIIDTDLMPRVDDSL